ncbi:unnamed protein product [Prorocentrum cordatum]|uniref:SGNH hydrolase-type esterase domain-containing protein n=1 Tax=Prorocentrum cordatum TaxID=2364126 RepID=A0ABN9WU40_9DINO|nr:unnamed protein product [Polarella glacialis]
MEYPWGPLRVALPTALLVASGAGVLAATRLRRRPCELADVLGGAGQGRPRRVCAVFVGDSLTQGSLSANWLEVLAERHPGQGEFVNCGLNMRPSGDMLDGPGLDLLEGAAAAAPERGVVVMLGTNDLIRFDLLSWPLRPTAASFVLEYALRVREIATRLQALSEEDQLKPRIAPRAGRGPRLGGRALRARDGRCRAARGPLGARMPLRAPVAEATEAALVRAKRAPRRRWRAAARVRRGGVAPAPGASALAALRRQDADGFGAGCRGPAPPRR